MVLLQALSDPMIQRELKTRSPKDIVKELSPLVESEDHVLASFFIETAQRTHVIAKAGATLLEKACRMIKPRSFHSSASYKTLSRKMVIDTMAVPFAYDAKEAYLTSIMRKPFAQWDESFRSCVLDELGKLGKLRRLRLALLPFVWTIKKRASLSLDAPGVGKRFVRDHGSILESL